MGCFSVHMGFMLQMPTRGNAFNMRREKKQASILVSRKPGFIAAKSVSTTQTDGKLLMEHTEFKSSFDEYLKAMESIRAEREKKKAQKGSNGDKKNLNNVSFSKDVEQDRKHDKTIKLLKTVKRTDFKEEDELSKESSRVVGKEVLDGSVTARGVDKAKLKLQSEVNSARLKTGSSKKLDTDNAAVTSVELIKNKRWSLNEMGTNKELEMEDFLLEQSELHDDVHDGRRISRMEMEERIQMLVRCLHDADMDMPEWMFSKTMRSAKIRFSDFSILRVIKLLGKLGSWRRVLQVVEWLQTHERFKSHRIRYVYTAALDVLGKARRPVEALNLFRAMQQHKTSYPDIVAYHSIAVTLGQAGHLKELFDVMDNMRSVPKSFKSEALDNWDPRLEPDIVVYNAVLNACSMRKEWEGAFWVFQKLEEVGQQPSSTTYGLAMEVMLACGKHELVHEFYRRLQESAVPNALTYRVLVNTVWREGKPEEAIAAIQDMESRGIVGSASVYYDLARCLCTVGRHKEALMQVDKICKVASKPLVVTYTGLIQACINCGNIHGGVSILNHMHKYCSPNLVTCNIMLKAYLGHGMFDEAKELFQKMTQSERMGGEIKGRIKPDIYTFNTMLEACIKEERWDDFKYAFEQMLCHGRPFNTKRHLWMVLRASSAGKVDIVETTWNHLAKADRVPPPALIKERFRLKMENGDLMAAVSSIASHPSTRQQSFSKEAWLKLLRDNAHCFNKEAIQQLICEVNIVLSNSESPNRIFQNLVVSCKEFVISLTS